MDIIQGNKLIAEFMGYYFTAGKYYPKNGTAGMWFKNPKYHCSYDALMNVFDKVEKIATETIMCYDDIVCEYSVEIVQKIIGEPRMESFIGVSDKSRLAAMYDAIIQYIQWYNTNQNS